MRIPIFLLILGVALPTAAAPTTDASLSLIRLYTGEDGLTHFAGGAVLLEMKDFSPPTPSIAVSKRFSATDIAFATLPPGWFGDWHPAPRRQYVLMLQGRFEIETGDGEKRQFGVGAVFLVEDINGQGHRTRVVSDDSVVIALVPSAP